MIRDDDLVFPLIPAHRRGALDVAGSPSRRRGAGTEIASSRPYRRGDAVRLIDWAASARLSAARGTDEFVVRDHFAEDTVRIVVVVDRSPSMALFPDWLPWLDKQAAVREVGCMIVASGAATNALIGFAAVDGREARVVPARRDRTQWRAIEQQFESGPADGPPESLDRALELLSRTARSVPPGTFVFLLSDFLPPPGPARLTDALAAGWDIIPVVVQDPVWERSFPDVSGRHAPAPRSRRPHVLARSPRPQGGTRPPRAQRAARRPARPHAARAPARPRDRHEQRQTRRAHGVSGLGRRATRRSRGSR